MSYGCNNETIVYRRSLELKNRPIIGGLVGFEWVSIDKELTQRIMFIKK